MPKDNPHTGHRRRLRDRALAQGLDTFDAHQVLELLLFYALPRQDTSALAHALIDRFGSIQGVMNADQRELESVPGIGRKTAEWLAIVGELEESYAALMLKDRPRVGNYRDVLRYCAAQREWVRTPSVYQLALTGFGSLLLFDRIADSLQWGAPEALRRSLKSLLAVHAGSVVIVEYAGDGVGQLDAYDARHADAYESVLRAVGIELMDVVIAGLDRTASLKHDGIWTVEQAPRTATQLSEWYLREDASIAEDEP